MKLNFVSKGYFRSIEEFVLIRQIGLGCFGKVELALHIDTNKFYALKIVKLDGQDIDEKELLLLERQIYLHSEIDHPHIIKLWDTIGDSSCIYLVMELAEEGSLFTYQNSKKVLSESEAFKFFHQTLKAVEYLHGLNIMHRDIKPQNILLDKNNNVKLCDFGWVTENIHQKRKTFCGTYEYMAPEMVFEKDYNYKIDVWGLGILLYELLHGYAPFKARSLDEIKDKISKGYYQINNGFSKQLKSLIIDLLQFQPEKRPNLQTVKDYAWVQKMKLKFKEEAIRIKDQITHQRDSHNAQAKNTANADIKYKRKNGQFLTKKHKRLDSMDPDLSTKLTEYQSCSKLSQNKGSRKNILESTNANNNTNQITKKLKKKCKTQGQESLEKYKMSQLMKPNQGFKICQASGGFIAKKRFQKQNSHNNFHNYKWSNFPQFSSYQATTKHQPVSMTKMKKISDKINEISLKSILMKRKKRDQKLIIFFDILIFQLPIKSFKWSLCIVVQVFEKF